MSSQGLLGAIEQYWDIQPSVRLNRRNTFFSEEHLSNSDALRLGVLISVLAMVIICFSQLMMAVLL